MKSAVLIVIIFFSLNNCLKNQTMNKTDDTEAQQYVVDQWMLIDERICDEIRLDGKLRFSDSQLEELDYCETLYPQTLLKNGTSIFDICRKAFYGKNYLKNSVRNEVWSIFCGEDYKDTDGEKVWRCVHKLRFDLADDMPWIYNDSLRPFDHKLPGYLKSQKCFKEAYGLSSNVNSTEEIRGSYVRGVNEVEEGLMANQIQLCDHRTDDTELSVNVAILFTKCFELLPKCHQSLMAMSKQSDQRLDFWDRVCDHKRTQVLYWTQCESSEFADMTRRQYFAQHLNKFETIVQCQQKSLDLFLSENNLPVMDDQFD